MNTSSVAVISDGLFPVTETTGQTVEGGGKLKSRQDQRAVILGNYILENKTTVRAAAKKFGISKSTVHTGV